MMGFFDSKLCALIEIFIWAGIAAMLAARAHDGFLLVCALVVCGATLVRIPLVWTCERDELFR